MLSIHNNVIFALLVLISATVLSHLVDAKREMAIVYDIQAPFVPNNFRSAVIDTQNSAAYFGTGNNPSQVCKYNVSSANVSFVSCIAATPGAYNFQSAVIDTQNFAAYFVPYTSLAQVCKYNVSSANFSFVSCIAAPSASGAHHFRSAVIDTHNSTAYFGTYTGDGSLGQVCKYNVSTANFSFVSCIAAPPGANNFNSAVIDIQNSAAYFATRTNPGQVCKCNISSVNFSFVSCIAAPPGANNFNSAVIDIQNSAAFFGTVDSNGQVCKFNISSANFSLISCIAAPSGAPSGARSFLAAVIDTQNSAAYFGTFTQVCKFNVSPTNFFFVSCITPPPGANRFLSAVINTNDSAAYFATETNPGQVCKLSISPAVFSFVSCIEAPPGPIAFSSAVIDAQNSAAYYGTDTSPGRVCKYNVSSMDSFFVSCIAASSGANYFRSAVIDTQNSAAYFSSYFGQVCKYNVSSANFSFVSCITAPSGVNNFWSAVIDTQNSAAYFGTFTNTGRVCRYLISSAHFSFASCIEAPSGANYFQSAVIDTQHSAAYFGTSNSSGQVCKFNISPANFSFDSCITAPSGANRFWSAVIDTQNSAAYFSTGTIGQVCKYNVSSTNFSFVSCITAPPGLNAFILAVIDAQNSAAYFFLNTLHGQVYNSGANSVLGQVCKFNISSANFSFDSCITAPPGMNNFYAAVIDTQSSAVYIGTKTYPSRVVKLDLNAFGCNSDGQLVIGQDEFRQSNSVNFVALEPCNVTISSVTVDHPITFLQPIGNSTITLHNITSTSTNSLVRLASSSPFSSTSDLIFEHNQFEGNRLLSSPSDVNLSNSSWSFKCNRWMNGYTNGLKKFASRHAADQVILDCPRTLSASQSLTPNQSESNTASYSSSTTESVSDNRSVSDSFSLSASSTKSETWSRSSSQSQSPSRSFSSTDSIYCTNFDEVTCNALPHQCKFCPTTGICVEVDQRCDNCGVLNEQFCPLTKGLCKYCPEHQVCVNATTTPTCDCVSFSSSTCAYSTCHYCSSESVCVPSQQSCGCINFTSTISINNSQSYCDSSPECHFCPKQQTCLPQSTPCTCHDMDQEQCDVSFLSPQTENSCKYCSNISVCAPKKIDCLCMALPDQTVCNVAGQCHWCSNYSTCAPKELWPDCNCESLNTSDFCSVISNDNCQWCSNASVCADPKFDCECELFSESVCSTSQCKWCVNMNTCTVHENKNCECYYLKTEKKCSAHSNEKCSWCPSSDPIGSYPVKGAPSPVSMSRPFQVTSNFNYCVNKTADRCECSYLSNEFCQFASSSSLSNYSSTCKYCSNLNLCTRADKNMNCDCGQEMSPRGCSLTSFCSVNPPVLTVAEDTASAYCAAAASASCLPVACQGITDRFACAASGCQYINFTETTGTCGTGDCFNFFVPGFTPQPFLLYFLGLFKDVIVVLLIGAIGDVFTRPIMNVVFKVKKKIKDWDHIDRRIKDQTLYMSDRICREGYSFSFSEYVEQICEDVFEFVDEDGNVQVLDDQHRLALFDITAFCLFDNMLWLEPVFDDDENENNTIVPKEREQTVSVVHSLNNEDDDKLAAAAKKDNVADEIASKKKDGGNGDEQMNRDQKKTPTSTSTVAPLPPPQPARRQRGFSMRTTPKSPNNNTYSPPNSEQVENSAPDSAAPATPRNNDSENQAKIAAPFVCEVVQLSSKDFDSLAILRSRVEDTLLQRGSLFIYYAQSRNKIVAACAAINSFPTALQLICYIVVVSALYVTSFITVASFPRITQVVSGCNSFSPQDSGVTFFGAFLLLGFRLMNASAEATSVLIFVKTIRGLHQKFTGLHDLTFQQRIPLMGLFTDRPIQITLFIYTLMIAPFALAGPFYGPSIDYRCLVPVFIGLGVLIVDWIVIFGIRWYSRNQRILQDQAKKDDHLRQARAERLLELDEQLQDNSNDNDDQSGPSSERPSSSYQNPREQEEFEEMFTGSHFSETNSEVSLSTIVSSTAKTSSKLQRQKRRRQLLDQSADGVIDEKLANQITIASAAPVKLGKAILVFLLTEELPVIAISLALQVSFNYMCLLHFGSAFGIGENEGYLVYSKDYNNRRLKCLWEHFTADASHVISLLSSIIPF